MTKFSYGLLSAAQAVRFAERVCDVLGHGQNGKAVKLLLETAAQETRLGQYWDPSLYGAGYGLCQIDQISFDDLKVRTREKHKAALKDAFGVDIDRVEHRELQFSPLLSFIFCRLHYKLIPAVIPVDVEGRAEYWKTYYNTVAGKGTPEEYLKNSNLLAGYG